MRIDLPDPGPGPHAVPLRQAFDALRRGFLAALSAREAAPAILLQAPDRSVWRVTVDSTGMLGTEKIQG
ncbi:MAG TPA: hypothetical protein VGM87_15365 [Roseomonas sp.]|jgi:hypothetical protein